MSSRPVTTSRSVLTIGSGPLGASLGLALRGAGVDVYSHDTSPTTLHLAQDIGAGVPLSDITDPPPSLVAVAAPPDVADLHILDALYTFPSAVITDIASAKSTVVDGVLTTLITTQQEGFAAHCVGSHPTAGRESLGAGATDADLFYGRPWVMAAHKHSTPQTILAVCTLAGDVGVVPVEMDIRTHGDSVALVSHVPRLMSSLFTARLAEARSESLGLTGQGVHDTTRIAASGPKLWMIILAGNTGPVVEVLKPLRADFNDLFVYLKAVAQRGSLRGGSMSAVNRVMEARNRGVSHLPGEYGSAPRHYALLEVFIPDKPDELGRLFAKLDEIGTNIEDLSPEHSVDQAVGLARIMVDPGRLNETEKELERRD